jgi:hypothetical protein
MRSPVLFLVFNRPETTRQVFDAIRAAKPPRLYVAADGPRQDRPGEVERCAEVRRIATGVDWPCEVKVLFREKNLGCKKGVSSGIDWFFEHEEEGIILEDDVLPVASFFPYCDELLERYRDDERVGLVSGCNLIMKQYAPESSYFFSRYNHIWGWASWRRAWKHYDINMNAWPNWRDQGGLKKLSKGNKRFERYWRETLEHAYAGKINTWDYQWTFACWRKGMFTILPAYNQTHNLGFGTDATHTTSAVPTYVKESAPRLLSFPMQHPQVVTFISKSDYLIDRYVFNLSLASELRRTLRNLPLFGLALRKVKNAVSKR